MSTSYRRGLGALGLIAGLALMLIPRAVQAEIYWANEGADTIASASLDGTVIDPAFITGATDPRGVALDGSYLYWAHDAGATGSIGRASLSSPGAPTQSFVATAGPPQGVAVDNTRIFWTQIVSGAGTVGRVGLSGGGVDQGFVATNASPCGVASDADETYWANGGTPGSLGNAHGGPPENQSFITATDDPCGVARADGYVYWTNRDADSIGRANQDGSGAVQDFIALSTTTGPCGVAVDGQHIYWTTSSDTIGRADLDGGNPDENFITDATAVQGPCGIAVTPTQQVTPSSSSFANTPVGSRSRIEAFFVADEGSSVLDVTNVSLAGQNPDDFEITGDGCTVNVTAAGNGCVVNVRFSPSAPGPRSAVLLVTSTASNSPTDVTLAGTGTSPSPAAAAGDTKCAKLRKKLNRRKRLDAKKGQKAAARREILRRMRELGCGVP